MIDRDRQILTVLRAAGRPLEPPAIADRIPLGRLATSESLITLAENGMVQRHAFAGGAYYVISAAGLAALTDPDRPTRAEWIMGLTFLLAMAVIGVVLLVVGE